MRIKVLMVSSEFANKLDAVLNFKIMRSFNAGLTWGDPQGFIALGGKYDPNIPESGIPGTIFNWDGVACDYRVELDMPVKFSCGFSFEVL